MEGELYVVGFLFSPDKSRVVLIEKQRPDWQRLRLNGVGGHVEPGESIWEAMRREFNEEAGLDITAWTQFAVVRFRGGRVCFLHSVGNVDAVTTQTDEKIIVCRVAELARLPVIQNLRWLIPMALDTSYVFADVEDPS